MADGLSVLAHRNDLPSYAVEVTVLPAQHLLLTQVVALAKTTPEQDAAAEHDTCSDVLSIARSLPGVMTQMVHHRAPGEVKVEHVADTAQLARRTRKSRAKTRRVER